MKFRTKLLCVMKLTAVIILIATLHVSAGTAGQTVSCKVKNASLEEVLATFKKQTGFLFIYNDKDIAKAKRVSLELNNAAIETALTEAFRDQPLTYQIRGNNVVVTVKQPPALAGGSSPNENAPPPANIDVTIVVLTAEGQPLEGASVVVKGSSKGVAADANGRATLKNISADAILIVSFTGYSTQEVKLSNNPGFKPGVSTSSSIVVKLQISTNELNEVIVNKGYYDEKQKYTLGNSVHIDAKVIERQPVQNPLLALQGRVPGLFITQSSGMPNSGVATQIQGRNSLLQGVFPLYIVDGVPYPSQRLSNVISGVLGTSGSFVPGSTLSFINPMDIESIEVLKDADATSIYGSRAANGAILITTKKGKAGKTKLDFNLQNGWGKMTRRIETLNLKQYLEMRREGIRNDNGTVSATDYDINGFWDTTRYTDWQKVFLGGTANYTDLQMALSGGNSGTQFVFGSNYHRETTVFPGKFGDNKGSVHFQTNSITPDQKFRFQFTANYTADKNELANLDFTDVAVYNQLAPDAPSLYNADGSLNWALDALGRTSWSGAYRENPLASLYRPITMNTTNLITSVSLQYQILNDLNLKLSAGYNKLDSKEVAIYPLESFDPLSRTIGNSLRRAQYANSTISSWIIEPQISYHSAIGKGNIEMLAGATIQQQLSDGQTIYGSNYSSDLLLKDPRSASSIQINTVASTYKYNAAFGRINYNLLDKYLVNITGRRDGSSRFGPSNRFHNFGSVGIGWIFTGENFAKHLPLLSFGKLRASYGTTGNDQLPDYQYMNLFSTPSSQIPYQGISGLDVSRLNNPYLQWEETKKLTLGLDLGTHNDRINFTVNYYRNRSSNQLVSYSLPYVAGFNNIQLNLPATIQNYGWEVAASAKIFTKAIKWTSSFNLTIAKNKLVSFPGMSNTSYGNYLTIGQPFTLLTLYNSLGVDANTGLYIFGDASGTLTSSPSSIAIKKDYSQQYYGGFENSFSYKGFQLDFMFHFIQRIGKSYQLGNLPGKGFSNQPVSVLGRWQKPGDNTSIERYFGGTGITTLTQFRNADASQAAYSNAGFVRLKNLSLSWAFPATWLKKLHLQTGRIYVLGQNLLTFTNYYGLDPETLSQTVLPPLRVITTGVQFSL